MMDFTCNKMQKVHVAMTKLRLFKAFFNSIFPFTTAATDARLAELLLLEGDAEIGG
jgi:hypothetical protein